MNAHNCDITILLVDFNAKEGFQISTNLKLYMGKHGVGVENDNGLRLLEL